MGENTKTWPFKLISLFFSLSSPLIPAGDRGGKGAKAKKKKKLLYFLTEGKRKKLIKRLQIKRTPFSQRNTFLKTAKMRIPITCAEGKKERDTAAITSLNFSRKAAGVFFKAGKSHVVKAGGVAGHNSAKIRRARPNF